MPVTKPLPIPPDEFKKRLSAMYRAIEVNAGRANPHDAMYETICSGWSLGGMKTCEILEAFAVRKYGFDRSKITWFPEYLSKLKKAFMAMTPRESELPF